MPARPEFAQALRLAVASIAGRAGFSYDDVEDLRVAVGEMCGILMLEDADARLTLRCRVSEQSLVLDVRREPTEPAPVLGELSTRILAAVAEDLVVDVDTAHISVTKHRRG